MSELTRPASDAAAVTPSNTTILTGVRGLYVGGAGNVSLLFPGDPTPVVFTAVPAGSILPVQAERVRSTDTTATAIVALF